MLVQETVQMMRDKGQMPADVNLDRYDADGCLDNLMIVVACEKGDGETSVANKSFHGLTKQYPTDPNLTVNGKYVGHYNIVTESGAYMGISESGLLIHEFLHTLGYPDLYRNNGGTPVSVWDIMSVESHRVQYPLAYYRSTVSKWFTIPTVTTDQQSYKLVAASASTDADKNNQAVILKTAHSDTEFFVIEYRKKGTAYDVSDEAALTSQYYNENSLDASIWGSGLIIYRINTDKTSNTEGGAWAAYVFRPGDSRGSDGVELASNDKITQSYLSQESGRTSYGSSDWGATIADNAITYSDGTNSGIVISNVGSAAGDTITFDITFTEQADNDNSDWTLLTNEGSANAVGAFMDSDGTIYCMETSYSTPAVYKYAGSSWTKVCDLPSGASADTYQLGVYNQTVYCAHKDTPGYLYLRKWSGSSGWSDVYKSSGAVNDFSIAANAYGLTLAYTDSTSGTTGSVYAYVLNKNGARTDTIVSNGTYASNIRVTMNDGTPYLAYREYLNNNNITVWGYVSGKWKNLGSSVKADVFDLTGEDQTLYLFAANGPLSAASGGYCYTYDLSAASPGWQQQGESFTGASLCGLKVCIHNGIPYVLYNEGGSPYTTRVKGYFNGTWTEIGNGVSAGAINGMALYGRDESLYVVYCLSTDGRIYIKKHAALIIPNATTTIAVTLPEGYSPQLYIDGIEYTTTYDNTTNTCTVDPGNKSAKVITAYKLMDNGAPSNMYVWTLSYQGTAYQVTALPNFEDILVYHGFSARITGETGLRYKSSIATDLKNNLLQTGGVDGYVLKEYGVIAIRKAIMTDYPLVYNGEKVIGTVDFKVNSDGTTSEILFTSANGRDYFTGLLKQIPKAGYKTNIVFRSYVILEKNGTQYIIYQMPVSRSLYYVCKQYMDNNRYASGTAEYAYIQQIITDAEQQ
jgi:M6 family metalloprotease-like protein